ncbi:MAG TPA: DUF6152 family protein [Gammaproteobacteria bacterium]
MGRWSLVLALAWAAEAAQGHHSIAGVYDSARPVTVEGRVTAFRFVNPHPILVIDVPGAAGKESWQLEMDNRFELAQVGITGETFAPGDRVVATGSAHRTESRRLYLRRLDRPADGARYEQVGSRPSFTSGCAAPRCPG